MDLSKVKPGMWVLADDWHGPFAEVAKITPARVSFVPRGHADPKVVKAAFATKAEAVDGHARYRETFAAGNAELEPLREAVRLARGALDAANHAVRQRAWQAAAMSAAETSPPSAELGATGNNQGREEP